MKKFLLFIICAACGIGAFASVLTPEFCSVGDMPQYHPLHDIYFSFDGAVGVATDATATIYSEGEAILSQPLYANNYVGENRTQGLAIMEFDSQLVLPKGKQYTVVVPAGVIYKEDDSSVVNAELSVNFEVPASLRYLEPSIEDGSVLAEAEILGFYFDTEIASIEGSEVILYRDDVELQRYPCSASWDWDLGFAGVVFDKKVFFENDVTYRLTLPAGNVSVTDREDITNEEVSVTFIGGSDSGVAEIKATEPTIEIEDNIITVSRIPDGTEVSLYSLDGKQILSTVAKKDTISMSIGISGIYLLTVNGKTFKLYVR